MERTIDAAQTVTGEEFVSGQRYLTNEGKGVIGCKYPCDDRYR